MTKIKFYCMDFCPFAQRAWIAIEEKKLWDKIKYVEVPTEFKGSKITQEFLKVSKPGTVPALHDEKGKNVWESIELIEYLEDKYPEREPKLFPVDPYLRWKARVLIKNEVKNFCNAFYRFLKCQLISSEQEKENFFETLRKLEDCLQGKYFLGDVYSVVDIAVFTFFERARITIPHYRKIEFLDSFPKLNEWFNLVSLRPAVKVTTGDRLERSLKVHVYPGVKRDDYLLAVYYPYFQDKILASKELFSKLDSKPLPKEEYFKLIDSLNFDTLKKI